MDEHKYNPVAIVANVKYDAATRLWFAAHPGQETTVMCCKKCGLYYKPGFGHKCKAKRGDGK